MGRWGDGERFLMKFLPSTLCVEAFLVRVFLKKSKVLFRYTTAFNS
ncbi:MAG: hypothetical protein F6K58_08185 [Symploca sp. SIO2E9]|nr:hypothetical protein [Symploca sp. SIO2E9]